MQNRGRNKRTKKDMAQGKKRVGVGGAGWELRKMGKALSKIDLRRTILNFGRENTIK